MIYDPNDPERALSGFAGGSGNTQPGYVTPKDVGAQAPAITPAAQPAAQPPPAPAIAPQAPQMPGVSVHIGGGAGGQSGAGQAQAPSNQPAIAPPAPLPQAPTPSPMTVSAIPRPPAPGAVTPVGYQAQNYSGLQTPTAQGYQAQDYNGVAQPSPQQYQTTNFQGIGGLTPGAGVNGPGGNPQVLDAAAQAAQAQLGSNNPYATQAFQSALQAGTGQLDAAKTAQQRALDEEMAKRGLYYSSEAAKGAETIGGGYQQGLANLQSQLLQQQANNAAGWQSAAVQNALAAGQGQQQGQQFNAQFGLANQGQTFQQQQAAQQFKAALAAAQAGENQFGSQFNAQQGQQGFANAMAQKAAQGAENQFGSQFGAQQAQQGFANQLAKLQAQGTDNQFGANLGLQNNQQQIGQGQFGAQFGEGQYQSDANQAFQQAIAQQQAEQQQAQLGLQGASLGQQGGLDLNSLYGQYNAQPLPEVPSASGLFGSLGNMAGQYGNQDEMAKLFRQYMQQYGGGTK